MLLDFVIAKANTLTAERFAAITTGKLSCDSCCTMCDLMWSRVTIKFHSFNNTLIAELTIY